LLGIVSIAAWDLEACFIFISYSNSMCYLIIVLSPVTFIRNWKTILKVIQKDTMKEMKDTVNIINSMYRFPCLVL